MKTTRTLTVLLACLGLAWACKPTTTTAPNTCVNAVAGAPDGSINVKCAWSGSCQTGDLEAAVNQLIGDAGACTEDTDCVFITDGGAFIFNDYTEAYVNPVAIANVESFQGLVESMICGFQQICDAGGNIHLISTGVPSLVPQSQLCLQCDLGQCVGNQVIPDSGS